MKAIICRSCSYRLRWVWARRPQLQKQQQLCGPPPPASVAAPPLIHARPRAVHKQHSEKQRQRAPLTTLKGYLLFYSDINHRAPTCGSMRRYSVKRPDTRTKCKKATRGIFLIKVRPQHNNSIHLQLPNYHTYNKSQGFFLHCGPVSRMPTAYYHLYQALCLQQWNDLVDSHWLSTYG